MGHVLLPQLMGVQDLSQVNQVEGFGLLGTQGGTEGGPLCVSRLNNDSKRLSRSIGNLFCVHIALPANDRYGKVHVIILMAYCNCKKIMSTIYVAKAERQTRRSLGKFLVQCALSEKAQVYWAHCH